MIEIIEGNPNYKPLLSGEFYTSIFHLYELYYAIFRDYGSKDAQERYLFFTQFAARVKDEHVFVASKFKLLHKRKRISYADAIGYAMAKEMGAKFLTGDEQFEKMDNVEYVK